MLVIAIGGLLTLGSAIQMGMGGTISDKDLAKLKKSYEIAKKAYSRHPSAKSKRELIMDTDRYATASMGSSLPSKVKYRQALHLYREVLKLDPANHEAKNNSDMLIAIYHEMHRPVPPS